jgi:dynein heavy chain
MAAELELDDSRVEFMADYVLRTLKLKPDRFGKMYSLEENKQMFMDYFEKPEHVALLLIATAAGGLTVQFEWPKNPKGKACYFVKKAKEALGKDNFKTQVLYGDMSQAPLDQLSAFVDEVGLFL